MWPGDLVRCFDNGHTDDAIAPSINSTYCCIYLATPSVSLASGGACCLDYAISAFGTPTTNDDVGGCVEWHRLYAILNGSPPFLRGLCPLSCFLTCCSILRRLALTTKGQGPW